MTWMMGVVLSVFILSSCGSTAHIQKDNDYNFSKVKTYAWVNGTQKDKGITEPSAKTNDLTDRKIRASVNLTGTWIGTDTALVQGSSAGGYSAPVFTISF